MRHNALDYVDMRECVETRRITLLWGETRKGRNKEKCVKILRRNEEKRVRICSGEKCICI